MFAEGRARLLIGVFCCCFFLFPTGPSNRSNSVSSLDLEGESVSESGAGPSGSNGVEALQLLEREQGEERPGRNIPKRWCFFFPFFNGSGVKDAELARFEIRALCEGVSSRS